MMRPNGVEKQVRPSGGGWQPGVNTLAYYKLNGDALDYSGNNYNGTWNGTESYSTLTSGIKVADFPYDSTALRYITSSFSTAPKTVSFWIKFDSVTQTREGSDWRQIIGQYSSESGKWQLRYHTSGVFVLNGTNYTYGATTDWTHICMLLDNGNIKIYINDASTPLIDVSSTTTSSGRLYIAGNTYGNNGLYKRALYGKMSEVILEDKVRTAQEISDYYDLTKGDYGL